MTCLSESLGSQYINTFQTGILTRIACYPNIPERESETMTSSMKDGEQAPEKKNDFDKSRQGKKDEREEGKCGPKIAYEF